MQFRSTKSMPDKATNKIGYFLAFSIFFTTILLNTSLTAFEVTVPIDCVAEQDIYNTSTTIYHGSSVEPTIAVNPKNKKYMVAAWQQDRISNGGAFQAGVAYSKDGGKHWHKSHIPFQTCFGGIIQRSGDEWLSYAADGTKVYLCASVLNATQEPNTENQFGVVVTVSDDNGKTWSKPRFLFSSMNYLNEPTKQFANSDKTSITADPNNPNNAIAVWANFNPSSSNHGVAQSSYTNNKGKNWSAVQLLYDPFPDLVQQSLSNGIQNDNQASNNVVVILPKKCRNKPNVNGNWLNFAVRVYATPNATNSQYTNDSFPFHYSLTDIVSIRSKDSGKTWDPHSKIVIPSYVNNLLFTGGYTYDSQGNITGGLGTLVRNDQTLPSYSVNPKNGFLYVAFQTSAFRSDQLQQIGLVFSRDGGHTWSSPMQVNLTPTNALNPQAFAPFVAVTKGGRVGVLYFDFRNDDRSNANMTKMDAWLAIYQEVKNSPGENMNKGLIFIEEIRLSETSYIVQNGPMTTQGVMTEGDYQFLRAQDNNFYAIYMKTTNGPFTSPEVVFTDPMHNATVSVDNNCRTVPFVSIVKNKKQGAQLLLTKQLPTVFTGLCPFAK
jgi:hypothetical protein